MLAVLPTEADRAVVVAAFGGTDEAPSAGSVSSDLGVALDQVLHDLQAVAQWYSHPAAAEAPGSFFAAHEAAVADVRRRMASACEFLGSGVAVWASGTAARTSFGRFAAAAESLRQWAQDVLESVHHAAVAPSPPPMPGAEVQRTTVAAAYPAFAPDVRPVDDAAVPPGTHDVRPSYARLAERARALHSAEHYVYDPQLGRDALSGASLPLLRALTADVEKECNRLDAVRLALEMGPDAAVAARFSPPLSHFTALRSGLQLLYATAAAADDGRAAAGLREIHASLRADLDRFKASVLPAILAHRDGVDAACERTAACSTFYLLQRRAQQLRDAVIKAFKERQQRAVTGATGPTPGRSVGQVLCCRAQEPSLEPLQTDVAAPPAMSELARLLGNAEQLWAEVQGIGETMRREFPADFHSDWRQRVGHFTSRLGQWAQGMTVVVAPPS